MKNISNYISLKKFKALDWSVLAKPEKNEVIEGKEFLGISITYNPKTKRIVKTKRIHSPSRKISFLLRLAEFVTIHKVTDGSGKAEYIGRLRTLSDNDFVSCNLTTGELTFCGGEKRRIGMGTIKDFTE